MATATIAFSSPQLNHKFAVRRHIKIIAVVCECGAVSHGSGVRKWKKCPRCGEPVITDKDQRYRDRHPWIKSVVDKQLHERYAKAETAGA
jgi:hypothetical protein